MVAEKTAYEGIGSFSQLHWGLRMLFHKCRWFFSCPLRLPIFPAVLGAKLSSMTYGEGILYGGILLQIPFAVWKVEALGGIRQVGFSGVFASLALYASFFLAYKQFFSLANWCCGLSFDRMIPFHKVASIVSVLLGIFHGWIAYKKWGGTVDAHVPPEFQSDFWDVVAYDNSTGMASLQPHISVQYALPATNHTSFSNVMRWSVDGWVNWSGTFLTLAMALLVLSSLFVDLRRKSYYLWLVAHVLFSLMVLVFGWVHFAISFPLIVTWGADLLFRYAYKACCRYPRIGKVEAIGQTGIVRLSWPKAKAFVYHPGQFVKIGLPIADKLVFHPMSIASCPQVDEEEVVVYVRAMGPWTNRLLEHSMAPLITTDDDSLDNGGNYKQEVRLYLEGPYGSMGIDLYSRRKHVLLCISGGVGVAPCISMAKWLLWKGQAAKVRFVWCVREWELVDEALPQELWDNPEELTQGDAAGLVSTYDMDGFEDEEVESQGSPQQQANSIYEERSDQLVETDLYLTSASASPADRKTTSTSVFYGERPKWDTIFSQTRSDALRLGYSRVSVVCCGPMIKDIQLACRQYSGWKGGTRVSFDLHEESFDF